MFGRDLKAEAQAKADAKLVQDSIEAVLNSVLERMRSRFSVAPVAFTGAVSSCQINIRVDMDDDFMLDEITAYCSDLEENVAYPEMKFQIKVKPTKPYLAEPLPLPLDLGSFGTGGTTGAASAAGAAAGVETPSSF